MAFFFSNMLKSINVLPINVFSIELNTYLVTFDVLLFKQGLKRIRELQLESYNINHELGLL